MSQLSEIVEIITIGREILDGRVIDTNSVKIANLLRPLGLVPRFGQRVDDEINRVVQAFKIAQSRSKIVLVTGGLGPTSDDLTAEAFSRFTNFALERSEEALAQIKAWFDRAQRSLLEVQKKQADLPRTCKILPNQEGTAPGFEIKFGDVQWYFMPGVPREMLKMLNDFVLPKLPRKLNSHSITWYTQFTSEGRLQEQLNPIEALLPPGFEVTYRTRFPENHVALYGDLDQPEEEKNFNELSQKMDQILMSESYYRATDKEPVLLLEEVVVQLLERNQTFLTTVESCTGGLIANRITDVAGSSNIFWGGHVVYENSAKEFLMGISDDLIKRHGAVSHDVALALAQAGLEKMREGNRRPGKERFICVSTTGIAGPSGGTAEKPVGLCYIGLADSTGKTQVEEIRGRVALDRMQNKHFFSQKALDLVRRF